ncbi:hypothetical protein HAX54_038903 [Datura stramonium]|uniref:Calmodulin n=1 Tax=Datura stramonium TaxID=4076 RepID=A0ABS8SIV6_DATST|nr:hypothetical protein [Datura stramonium]
MAILSTSDAVFYNDECFGRKETICRMGSAKGQNLTNEDDFFTNPMIKEFYKNHVETTSDLCFGVSGNQFGIGFCDVEAKKYKIHLILGLVNNWEALGGKKQYVEWARQRGQQLTSEDDFFTNPMIKEFYKNHVKVVLTRVNTITKVAYKDDPTILSWELMNEPRCTSDISGKTIQIGVSPLGIEIHDTFSAVLPLTLRPIIIVAKCVSIRNDENGNEPSTNPKSGENDSSTHNLDNQSSSTPTKTTPPPTSLSPSSSKPSKQSPIGPVLGRPMEDVRTTYNIGKELGRGQFGVTHLCTHKQTGDQFACKTIAKRKLANKEDVEDVRREVQIMHHLAGQPNIVELKGAYEDKHSVHLVMELCAGGELFDRIIAKGHYTERAAAALLRTIVQIDENAPLKATDFGLSVFYKQENENGIFSAILTGHVDFSSDPWPSISSGAKDLVRKMLAVDPRQRLTAMQNLNHSWIKEDGEAPDTPLDNAVLHRLKQFRAMNKFKKVALRADADGNGTIDYEEFITATMHMNKMDREEHLYTAFDILTDRNGMVGSTMMNL